MSKNQNRISSRFLSQNSSQKKFYWIATLQVIKIGGNGEYIYPSGHPSNATSVSVEQDETNNNAAPEVILKPLIIPWIIKQTTTETVVVGLTGEEGEGSRRLNGGLAEGDC